MVVLQNGFVIVHKSQLGTLAKRMNELAMHSNGTNEAEICSSRLNSLVLIRNWLVRPGWSTSWIVAAKMAAIISKLVNTDCVSKLYWQESDGQSGINHPNSTTWLDLESRRVRRNKIESGRKNLNDTVSVKRRARKCGQSNQAASALNKLAASAVRKAFFTCPFCVVSLSFLWWRLSTGQPIMDWRHVTSSLFTDSPSHFLSRFLTHL